MAFINPDRPRRSVDLADELAEEPLTSRLLLDRFGLPTSFTEAEDRPEDELEDHETEAEAVRLAELPD